MTQVPYTRVVLEIQPGVEPLRGYLAVAGQPLVPFDGWLELMSALDRITGPPADRRFEAAPQEER